MYKEIVRVEEFHSKAGINLECDVCGKRIMSEEPCYDVTVIHSNILSTPLGSIACLGCVTCHKRAQQARDTNEKIVCG